MVATFYFPTFLKTLVVVQQLVDGSCSLMLSLMIFIFYLYSTDFSHRLLLKVPYAIALALLDRGDIDQFIPALLSTSVP